MSAWSQDEPLLQYGVALARVVAAVEASLPAESTLAFDQAAEGGQRAGELLAWLAAAEPDLALQSVSLVAMQLARVRELIARGIPSGRLSELYNPELELVFAIREVQLRVGLAAATTRRELGLSLKEFATRLRIQVGRAALLEAGRLQPDRDLASAIDAILAGRAAGYLEAAGGSASAAVHRIDRLQSLVERLRPQ